MRRKDWQPLIINVRGTSGSGKTHLTRQIMDKAHIVQTIKGGPMSRVQGYVLDFQDNKQPMFVLGKYDNTCGGCDTIKTQQEIVDRVEWGVEQGYNIWLEGLILSTIYGTVGAYSEKYDDRWLFCYIDTPVHTCLERVLARRHAAGNTKEFNPHNTEVRHETIKRNMNIAADKGRRTLLIPHKKAVKFMLDVYNREAM